MTMNERWRDRVSFAYIDEPPFAAPLAGGLATGCDVELALTGLRALGVRHVELVLTRFAELLAGVEQGRWTMNTPLFLSAERRQRVAFSRPVWALQDGLVLPAGNPKGIAGYRAIATGGHRLAIVAGQIQGRSAIAAGVSAAQIIELPTQHEALLAVRHGHADAYASTALGNRTVLERERYGDLTSLPVQDEPAGPLPVGAFSFAHESIELRLAFDDFLARYLGSAEHRERMGRHGLTRQEIDPIATRPPTENAD